MSITWKTVTLTPVEAAELLKTAVRNRKVVPMAVKKYASDMAEGRWMMTGAPIIFDDEGHLIDGQHRLKACVVANVPFVTTVVLGVKSNAQDYIDIGAIRTVAQQLGLRGLPNTNAVSAVARLMGLHANGENYKFGSVSKPEVLEIATMNFKEILRAYNLAHTQSVIPASALAFCYLRFLRVDEAAAIYFAERVADGAGMQKGNPILSLREAFLSASIKKVRRTSIQPEWVIALTIKAWNAYRRGRSLFILRWIESEPFPVVDGEE